MARALSVRPVIRNINDRQMQRLIVERSVLTNKTVKDETRTVFKGLVRDGLRYNPPASAQTAGKSAQRAGQAAISRDIQRMGFTGREIKGHRTIKKAFGRPIAPVTVPTKVPYNQLGTQAEVDIEHRIRLAARHGGRVTRGRRQAWYVDKRMLNVMVERLFAEVGRLASWLVPAAQQLGVLVPAWIARHGGSGRGTQLQVVESQDKIAMRVVGHFPDTANKEADEMMRRITALKEYAINRLKNQMPYLLRRKMRSAA